MKKPQFYLHSFLVVFLGLSLGLPAQAGQLVPVGFGKYLDYQDWETKIQMNFNQLATSVHKQVDLYRFDLKYESTPNKSEVFQAIPYITQSLAKAYDKTLVYNRSKATYIADTELDNPTHKSLILLRQDCSHWTLIHEYTHHLFHTARKMMGQSLPKNYRELYDAYFNYLEQAQQDFKFHSDKFQNSKQQSEVIAVVQKNTDLILSLQVNFFLEEVVIENMIRQYYVKYPEQFKKDELKDYENSLAYVESRLQKVLDTTDHLKSTIQLFHQAVTPSSTDEQNLSQSMNHILQLENQIRNFKVVQLNISEDLWKQ